MKGEDDQTVRMELGGEEKRREEKEGERKILWMFDM